MVIYFNAVQEHNHDVGLLLKQLRKEKTAPYSLAGDHRKSNTTRNASYKKQCTSINLASFNRILAIDREIAWIEPKVTMERLCRASLKQGVIPRVVTEFKQITAGGAVLGAALESSSFRYGQFSDSCLSYEVILGDGTLINASPQEHHDLFFGLSGSYGTLGIIVSIKLSLTPARSHVSVRYHSCSSYLSAIDTLQNLRKNPDIHFLDAIAYCPNKITVMEGRFCTKNNHTFSMKRLANPWFYQHAYSASADIIPLLDYLFRYDLGAFWMGSYLKLASFFLHTIRNNPSFPPFLFRLLLNPLLSTAHLYHALHSVSSMRLANLFVVQDFYLTIRQAVHFLEKIDLFPIWLCPIQHTDKPQILSPHFQKGDLVNIGVYGHTKNPVEKTQSLENLCQSLGGRKMLYSQTYYTQEQFWTIYDRKSYLNLRQKYASEGNFLSIDEKIIGI